MHATEGIVLKKMDVGEHDALYMFYTRDYGKMRAVAAGIKKPEAKLRGHLEVLSLARIRFVAGRRREKLVGAFLVNFWPGVRRDARKLEVAHHMAHRIDLECMEGERDDALWELLARSFCALDADGDFEIAADDFVRRFDDDLRGVLGYGGPDAPAQSAASGGREMPDYDIISI